jgi:hypothetical protein
MIKSSRRTPAFCVVERNAFNWVCVAGKLIERTPLLIVMFYRLKFENYSRLKCLNPVFLNKEILQKKFFEFTPRAVRYARLRFEYKIR